MEVSIILRICLPQRGWLHESEWLYYLGSTGAMQGWYLLIENVFQDNGLMAYSQWFAGMVFGITLNSEICSTGWKEIEGSYYF